ncbi:MAG: DUF4433 domain-containing protein [Chloroflexia bacterium]|nr:DUF4433 domain-containing protein [Chloroflexia bacterium]
MANLPSIVRFGILSHERARALPHVSVASAEVQAIRSSRTVPNGLPLHHYANLYIDARNAMMYARKDGHLDLCAVRVSADVLDLPDVVIADRNAAAEMARFGASPQGLALIDRELVCAEWWNSTWEAKQIRCAEVLVPGLVHPQFLIGAYVSCQAAWSRFGELDLTEPRLQVTMNEHLFYR